MIFTRRDIELGDKARSVVENEAFKKAFECIHDVYTQAFINTAEDESAKRERAYMAIRMLDEVEAQLISMMDKGKLAKQHLDKLNRR
jgi:hypothetical protein